MMFSTKIKMICCICFAMVLLCSSSYSDELEEFNAMVAAAQNNNADAQVDLAKCYLEGYGVEQNNQQAAAWFAKATQQGHPEGMYSFACMLINGVGVEKDTAIAISILNDAKEAGSLDAAVMLGSLAESGFEGTPPDYEVAIGFYGPASESGSADATYALALMVRDGRGIEQDIPGAKEGLEEAIKQGSIEAAVALAVLIMDTEEVSEGNIERVHELLSFAADNGNEDAIQILNELAD